MTPDTIARLRTATNSLCGPLDIHPDSINGWKVYEALLAAYRQGIEDAAKVAENELVPMSDSSPPGIRECCAKIACAAGRATRQFIVEDIRALLTEVSK